MEWIVRFLKDTTYSHVAVHWNGKFFRGYLRQTTLKSLM